LPQSQERQTNEHQQLCAQSREREQISLPRGKHAAQEPSPSTHGEPIASSLPLNSAKAHRTTGKICR